MMKKIQVSLSLDEEVYRILEELRNGRGDGIQDIITEALKEYIRKNSHARKRKSSGRKGRSKVKKPGFCKQCGKEINGPNPNYCSWECFQKANHREKTKLENISRVIRFMKEHGVRKMTLDDFMSISGNKNKPWALEHLGKLLEKGIIQEIRICRIQDPSSPMVLDSSLFSAI